MGHAWPLVAAMLRCVGVLWACSVLALASTSTSPNSAVMPSVSYLDLPFGWNRSSLEKDIAAVFNKVAYGSSTTPPSAVESGNTTSSAEPPPPPVTSTVPPPTPLSIVAVQTSSTPAPLPHTPSTLLLETPEYTSRTRFKPPLPPEYTNPFADKPILRGSQSESSAGGAGRGGSRPIPPPPPRPPRPPPEQERIPIRPPDLRVPHDRSKKPLNTPARGTVRPQHSVTYTQELSRAEPRNDTAEFDFVPILQNPSVTRILSGSSGRKVEDDARHSLMHLDHLNRDVVTEESQPPSPPPPLELEREEEVTNRIVEDVVPEQAPELEQPPEQEPDDFPADQTAHEESDELLLHEPYDETPPETADWGSHVYGVAWDIHVYLMGSLFALLAIIAIVNFVRTYKKLLPSGYFISLNGLLLVIGVFRSIFLLFDAYNLHHSYPSVIGPLMLHFAFPCLTSAFAILFLYLLQTTKVKLIQPCLQTPPVVTMVTLSHLLLCLSLDIIAGFLVAPHAKFLLLVCQALFLVWGVTLAVTYLFVFGALSQAALRQQCDFLRAPSFTKLAASLPPQNNPTLGLAVRALLATAMLMLLLAAVQLYGLFGVDADEPQRRPWPWWGFQFSVRVIEVSMCFLMVFVATLRVSDENNSLSVLTLFSCNNCAPKPDQSKQPAAAATAAAAAASDDLYPAICNTNQALHNYSLQTGKKVYNDSLPLTNMPMAEPVIPVSMRASIKKSIAAAEGHHSPGSGQRPSSMLFAEDGFVRFRTSADPEQPMEEVLHQSMNRKTCLPHEAAAAAAARPAFIFQPEELLVESAKVRYRATSSPQQQQPSGYDNPDSSPRRTGDLQTERRQSSANAAAAHEMWHSLAASSLHGPLSPAHLRYQAHLLHHQHPSVSSDSDLASNSEDSSHVPSSSQDITPDSAVGSDIYSKNGEGPVENNRYWCDDEQVFGLDLLSRSLISRLRGSNFSLNHLQGYTPLDTATAAAAAAHSGVSKVLLHDGLCCNANMDFYINARAALYPEDESAV